MRVIIEQCLPGQKVESDGGPSISPAITWEASDCVAKRPTADGQWEYLAIVEIAQYSDHTESLPKDQKAAFMQRNALELDLRLMRDSDFFLEDGESFPNADSFVPRRILGSREFQVGSGLRYFFNVFVGALWLRNHQITDPTCVPAFEFWHPAGVPIHATNCDVLREVKKRLIQKCYQSIIRPTGTTRTQRYKRQEMDRRLTSLRIEAEAWAPEPLHKNDQAKLDKLEALKKRKNLSRRCRAKRAAKEKREAKANADKILSDVCSSLTV